MFFIYFCEQNHQRMRSKTWYADVLKAFESAMPVAETELHYNNAFELLVAVILSAQCTDKRVNTVTPALFRAYPTPAALAAATPEDVFAYIRSVSYPNNKARHLVGMARHLLNHFGGEVPSELTDLVKLPGVGRKTANVIQAVVFQKAAMAVDTHVFRVSHRIGLVPARCTTPLSVEKELMRHVPEALIPKAHHWLILHGRYTCMARKPLCETCFLQKLCRHYARTYAASDSEKTPAIPTKERI